MMIHEQLGIYKIKLILPFRLNHVNCYAVKGSDGWWLVDAGLGSEATTLAWQKFFKDHEIEQTDIKGIYVTHFHPDHYGCSGWLQDYSGAPVYIGEIDANRINHYRENEDFVSRDLGNLFRNNGMPEDVLKEVMDSAEKLIHYMHPHSKLTILKADQVVKLGDYEYKVILTPGHSDGHICFYNVNYGVIFSGDHLLPKISPNISLLPQPGADPNPLGNFLCSLNSIRRLTCKLVLPAHGKPFSNIEDRISKLEFHHKERLEVIKDFAGSGANAYQVCRQVFDQNISAHELRFAMGETLAHLSYSTYKGELEVVSTDGINRYSKKES